VTAIDLDDDWDIEIDKLGWFTNNLTGYETTSVLREQLQNADDACHEQGRRGELAMRFLSDRLTVTNPSVFGAEDWRRVRRPNARGKALDAEQTGEYGKGFWGALHLTDAPIITSGTIEATLHPLDVTRRTVPLLDGTRFEFIYRREATDLSRKIRTKVVTAEDEREMANAFVDQMAQLLLFTRAIDTILIELPDGSVRRAARTIESVGDNVERLAVHVAGDPVQDCAYVIVRTALPDPPEDRHGRISVALPISDRHRGSGRAFFMFPTETDSGLNLSVDAHFRATDDRRSLENSGEKGRWNARIFDQAGRAVGEVLETVLDPAVHGLGYEDGVTWFVGTGSHLPEINRRAQLFLDALDAEAVTRNVIPDRQRSMRRGDELVRLPDSVDAILSAAVGNTAARATSGEVEKVYTRWGLRTWGPATVAEWLRDHVPHIRTKKSEAPSFMKRPPDTLALLEYCRGQEPLLQGVSMLLATDQSYHPIGGPVAKPSDDLRHLVEGLGRPLVERSFLSSLAAKFAPTTNAQWLHGALLESAERIEGRKVGSKAIGVTKNQQHVAEALAVLCRSHLDLEGIPLAMDETGLLHVFGTATVTGLPQGAPRKPATALARRLGLQPLHSSIDDDLLAGAAQTFSVSYIVELIPSILDWDPVQDSQLVVSVVGAMAQEATISAHLIESLRSLSIWQSSDGRAHGLDELWLPARDRISSSSRLLVAEALCGPPDGTSADYATFNSLFGVQVLDIVEEVVLACENPPAASKDLDNLLLELGDCGNLSRPQEQRLRKSEFVLCRDGKVRAPGDVLLTTERLPLWLGDRCVIDTGQDRRVRSRLEILGATELPRPGDLLEVASDIAGLPIAPDLSRDPGRILWDHLQRNYEAYAGGTLGSLASIAWLVAAPGPVRKRPRECFDPNLSFASLIVFVPYGVPTILGAFRDALKMRATLETEDFVRLGKLAAESGVHLSSGYFQQLNRRTQRDTRDERLIADLRSEAIVPLTSGLTRPDLLVSQDRAAVWGHLRDLVPDLFVSDYPNLLRAWAVSSDNAVDWHEHLDVLEELASRGELTSRDRALAQDRIVSLVRFADEDQRLETIRRRGHLLTSIGLRPCIETLRGDLPPAVTDRLSEKLAVVEESDATAALIDVLELRSLRSAVELDPLVEDVTPDDRWPGILRIHKVNVLRFLKAAGKRLEPALIEGWPPIVEGVSSLTVRATFEEELIDEWAAEAHLAEINGELVLYVCGDSLDARAVVDAISYEFGVDRGKKSLLLGVLQARSALEGEQALDWENIPQLSAKDAAYVYDHASTEVAFVEDEASTDAEPGTDAWVDDNPVQPDAPEELAPPPEEEALVGEPTPADEAADEGTLRLDDLPAPADETLAVVTPLVGPDEEAAAGDSGERFQSPRGTTDREALRSAGISIVRDLDDEVADDDYLPEPKDSRDEVRANELRVCLSFFDVSNGHIPVSTRDLGWLCSGVELREVILFGEHVTAARAGPKHVRIEGGPSIYHSRQVVPGTVLLLHPSVPGTIEIVIRPDVHRVNGVWMLEFDEHGQLSRLRQDDIELQWETDDAFYRAERRLEDIEALMADGGKSAVQLIIEVFLARPDGGLTAEEIWGLVAISRLFAKSTIAQTLSTQTGLFAYEDGLWFKVGDQLRVARAPKRERSPSVSTGQSPRKSTPEVIRVARKLAQLLSSADDETLAKVIQLLGLAALLDDRALSDAAEQYLASGDGGVLRAIEDEIRDDPGRSAVIVSALEELDTPTMAARRPLVEVVVGYGNASAVVRAQALLKRIDAVSGDRSIEPIERVQQLLTAYDESNHGILWDAVEEMWAERHTSDPLVEPAAWLADIANREAAHRRAVRTGEPPQRAVASRTGAIGWLSAQLPGEVYDDPAIQRLRIVIDLVMGASAVDLLDGLHQLALLAEKSPDGAGDASLLYALVIAHARATVTGTSPVISRSRHQLKKQRRAAPGVDAERFADLWCDLARLPMTDVLKQLQDASKR